MNIDKSIELLNTLIEINNDRIEVYVNASKATEKYGLKKIFYEFQQTSQKCKLELIKEIEKLGGIPIVRTKITGFFNFWITVKTLFICKDCKDVISTCESNEHKAEQQYNHILIHKFENLSFDHQNMLRKQYLLINADNNKVRVLRDILVENKYFH